VRWHLARYKARHRARFYWDIAWAKINAGVKSILYAIASCESGHSPTAVSPDGLYRGRYQFDTGTWASVGGRGDPAAAPAREQDVRAAWLYAARGGQPWPNCP